MLKRLVVTLMTAGILISTAYAAETDWSLHIKVSVPDSRGVDGTVWNHIIAGVREGATDGYDSAWDTISMVEADDPVQAMFTHGILPEDKNNDGKIDGWMCSIPDNGYGKEECSLWRDIRAFRGEQVWSFLILSTLNGSTVTLQWAFDSKPENINLVLVDLSEPEKDIDIPEKGIDIKDAFLYSYTNNFETGKRYGVRYFEIRMETKGLFILPPALPDATIGARYNKILSAIGGAPVWSLEDGDLPPGMSINAYTGEVTGTPSVIGSYRFTVRGEDTASGYSSTREYTININSTPKIISLSQSEGVIGTGYTGYIEVSGGSAPLIWDIRGNLPEGVTLDNKTGFISGGLIVPGIYDFTAAVKDANGATDSGNFRITVVEPEDKMPPEAIKDLSGIYLTDTSALLLWSAPADHDSLTGTAALYDMRYLEDCPDSAGLTEGLWDKAVEATGEPRPQSGALQTYTLTGFKAGKTYCIAIKGMDSAGHVSAMSNIVMLPLTSDISRSGFAELTSSIIFKRGYNFISLPLIPVPNVRDLLFGPIVGEPVALYRWYSPYPDITPPQYYLEDIIMPGLGYFLYSPEDVTMAVSGLKIEKPEYELVLQHGWNMIGTPYDKSILLRDIQVKNIATGEIKPYMDALKGGWIGNTIYRLQSGNYDFASFNDNPPAALEPWVGYWIYVGNESGVEIIFRRP